MNKILYFKILSLTLMLISVLIGIKYFKSSEFIRYMASDQNGFGPLLGTTPPRLFNWCPNNTVSLQINSLSGNLVKTIEDKEIIRQFCELAIEPTTSSINNQEKSYVAILIAQSLEKKSILKKNTATNSYEANNLPFSSIQLNKLLKENY